jgi:putative membrane fusion protein
VDKKRLKQAKQRFEVLPGEGKKFSFSNLKQALFFYLVLLVVLVVLTQIAYHWFGDQFQTWRLGIVEAEPGLMQQQIEATGIITRNETVVTAPVDGVIIRLAALGERVPVGFELARIGQLSPAELELLKESEENELSKELWGTIQQYWQQAFEDEEETESAEQAAEDLIFIAIQVINSEEAGLVSYYLDSWERFNGPLYLTEEELEREPPSGTYTVEGSLVEQGQPICKIVDNWRWFYSVVLPFYPGKIIGEMPEISLEFDFSPGEIVQGSLINAAVEDDLQEVRLTYQIERQLPGFDLARIAVATLLYEQKSGIIVPEEAVLNRDKTTGIYASHNGRVVFVPVTVVEKQGDQIMIEGIEPYSLVITRPDMVTEGQRLD